MKDESDQMTARLREASYSSFIPHPWSQVAFIVESRQNDRAFATDQGQTIFKSHLTRGNYNECRQGTSQ